jgi:trimeric autotransporter adhesin
MSRRFWVCVPLLLSVLLVACGSNPAVTQLSITPNAASLNIGATTQFKATASFIKSNQTQFTQDVTSQVVWSSSNPAVATIDATGLAKGIAGGSTAIVATLKSGSTASTNSANVTVSLSNGPPPHELLSIAITPSAQTLTSIGQTAQLIAIGTFSTAPTTQDITQLATWVSSTPAVASIVRPGIVMANAPGTATITASFDSISGAKVVGTATVNETSAPPPPVRDLQSISIIPIAQTLTSLSQTAQFTAVGTYSAAPSPAVITSGVTWGSSVLQVATINSSSGLATATGPGTTAITASAKNASGQTFIGTATLTEQANIVTTRELLGISIIPSSQSVPDIGDTAQFIAVGTFSSAPVTDILRSGVQWSSTVAQVATIDPATGLATAIGPGSTTILATAPSASGAVLVGVGSLAQGTGPSQTPVLTVIKLGANAAAGLITSAPTGISCGAACSATFPLSSTVTLTALPTPASWSGNCLNPLNPNGGSSADGSQCVVIMANNTVVAAVF